MSFFGRIAARAAAAGPVLQPKDGGVRRAAAHEEEDAHRAMRAPIRRMDAKAPEEEPHAARASAKPDEEPAVARSAAAGLAIPARRAAAEEGEEPKAHRAAAPQDDKHEMHRAAAPEEEPKARPSRRAPAANVHDPEGEEAVHRAAAKDEPHDEALHRALAPGPEELTPDNSPVPNQPPQTGVKPLVMAIRRDAAPAAPPVVPTSNIAAGDAGRDAPTGWTPASDPEVPVAQAPFASTYEPPAPLSFASQTLDFSKRPDVVIDRIDVLVQEPSARPSAGVERSAARSLRARYLRSL